MAEDGLRTHAVLGLFLQEIVDEVYGMMGDVSWEFKRSGVGLPYLFHCLFARNVVEGSLPNDQLVSENPNTPEVDAHVILCSFQNLRSRIVEGSTVCSSPFIANGSPSKIAQFCHAAAHNYIFRLDVSMSHSNVMKMLYRLRNLFDHFGGFLL
jgi:hypothetical protein